MWRNQHQQHGIMAAMAAYGGRKWRGAAIAKHRSVSGSSIGARNMAA